MGTSPYKSDPKFALYIYSKNGGNLSGVGIKTIKSDNFQYFSIKSYVWILPQHDFMEN